VFLLGRAARTLSLSFYFTKQICQNQDDDDFFLLLIASYLSYLSFKELKSVAPVIFSTSIKTLAKSICCSSDLNIDICSLVSLCQKLLFWLLMRARAKASSGKRTSSSFSHGAKVTAQCDSSCADILQHAACSFILILILLFSSVYKHLNPKAFWVSRSSSPTNSGCWNRFNNNFFADSEPLHPIQASLDR